MHVGVPDPRATAWLVPLRSARTGAVKCARSSCTSRVSITSVDFLCVRWRGGSFFHVSQRREYKRLSPRLQAILLLSSTRLVSGTSSSVSRDRLLFLAKTHSLTVFVSSLGNEGCAGGVGEGCLLEGKAARTGEVYSTTAAAAMMVCLTLRVVYQNGPRASARIASVSRSR